jgi:hypothetical protein
MHREGGKMLRDCSLQLVPVSICYVLVSDALEGSDSQCPAFAGSHNKD